MYTKLASQDKFLKELNAVSAKFVSHFQYKLEKISSNIEYGNIYCKSMATKCQIDLRSTNK